VTNRLCSATLRDVPANVRKPAYDFANLKTGIVHLGLGAFHRAHQAVFTEDAMEAAGGDWGIAGASLHHAAVPDALTAQDGLYTVEMLGSAASYRIVGAIHSALFGPRDATALIDVMASPQTHVITLTVTEKGYCLNGEGALDMNHPDIAHDLAASKLPRSAIGRLVRGLAARHNAGGAPLTVLSCDNLSSNGAKLRGATMEFAERTAPQLLPWLRQSVAFPNTLVDCIVPAPSETHRARVEHVLGMRDEASVQREEFAQWVIENKFAGPIPEWGSVGAEIVDDVDPCQRLKLHILNTCHSALAYMGIPRGHEFVRQAIADPELATFCDALVKEEIAPALVPLDATAYWHRIRQRLANPMLDHKLAQIAEDGSAKLAQRVYPLMIDNARQDRAIARLGAIVRAWLSFMARSPSKDPQSLILAQWSKSGADAAQALDNPVLFPAPFRSDPRLREAVLA
jgi:fructuronate reductase